MHKYYSIVKSLLANRNNKRISDVIADKLKKTKDKNRKYISAATLFPLIDRNDKIYVILTERSDYMNDHPGQVCFPGGKYEVSDKTMENCAKREALEEIGMKWNQINILGELDKCITSTGFQITPIVASIDYNFIPKIDKGEVSKVFEVPLEFLTNYTNRNIVSSVYKSNIYSFYEYNWENKRIWGSTAKIIVNFCDIIKEDLNI